MSPEILKEMYFLLHSVIMGVVITFVYDWLRIFRRVVKHNNFFVSLEDLLYWIFCFICVFLMLYRENNGTLRWFAIIGAAVGMLLYKLTVSRILVKYLSSFIRFLIRILTRILLILLSPIVWLIKKAVKACRWVFRKMKKAGRAVKRRAKRKTKVLVDGLQKID